MSVHLNNKHQLISNYTPIPTLALLNLSEFSIHRMKEAEQALRKKKHDFSNHEHSMSFQIIRPGICD
jgi:hypothetical protein